MITPVAQWHWCHNSSHGEQRCCNPLGWSACICSDEAAYDNPNECHWRFVAKTQGPSQLPVAAQRGLPSLANGSTPIGLLPPCPLQVAALHASAATEDGREHAHGYGRRSGKGDQLPQTQISTQLCSRRNYWEGGEVVNFYIQVRWVHG